VSDLRYEKLAEALMAAPDPVRAVASELGDQHARIDVMSERLRSLEFKVSQLRSMQGPIA
jgi:hypothetical protein